ncbi:MAG: PAS domain S-box protein [Phycisphaerae bacterium]|nr:PAS domain S-box protein [Phycisphaerae bacterium]
MAAKKLSSGKSGASRPAHTPGKNGLVSREDMKRPLLRLQILVVGVTLLAVAVTIFFGRQNYLETKRIAAERFNRQQLSLARSAARGIESYFKELSATLESLAKLPNIRGMKPECMQCLQHTYRGFPPRTSIRLLDKDGVIRFIYPFKGWRGKLIGRDYSNKTCFRKTAENGHITTDVITNEQGESRICISVPIYAGQQREKAKAKPESTVFQGVIIGSFAPRMIAQNLVHPIVSGKTGYAWMLDDKGVFISHHEKGFVGRDAFKVRTEKNPKISYEAAEEIQRKMLAGQEGVGQYVSGWHRGKEGKMVKLVAYTPVRVNGKTWSVAVCAPISEVQEVVRMSRRSKFYTVGFVILALMTGGVLFFMTSRRWSRTLEQEVRNRTDELKETSDFLTRLMRFANASIIVWGPDNRITQFNRASERLTGYSVDEVMGHELSVLFPESDKAKSLDEIARAANSELWESVEIPIQRKDGQTRFVLWNLANIYSQDGTTALATIAQGIDITERKRAEEDLRKTERRYRLTTEAGQVGVWDWDLVTNAIYLDPHLKAMLGYADDEIPNRLEEWGKHVHPDDAERVMAEAKAYMEGKTPRYEVEHRMLHKDGGIRWFLARGTAILGENGKPVGVLGTDTDITALKQAQEQISRYNKELEDIVRERTERLEKLQRERAEIEKQAAAGRLAARIAHEINNPLAGIKNSFLVIKTAIPENHPCQEFSDLIEREIERIARIVRQMFDLYGPKTAGGKDFAIDEVLRDMTVLLESECRARRVSIVLETPASPIRVRLPKDSVFQILFNILLNAIEASPTDGKIGVTFSTQENDLTISVADEGSGIPEDMRSKVFEPLFTTKPTNGKSKAGSGLGLSISLSLVKAMGGSLDFESKVGRGTVFRITLPLNDNQSRIKETEK